MVDIVLALTLFKPSLVSRFFSSQISVTSSIPSTEVSFANKKYLQNKLDKLGFWNKDKVNLYASVNVRKVTVTQLKINLTDKPQNLGLISGSKGDLVGVYSYGQKYNQNTGVMELTIYVDPDLQKEQHLDWHYSYYVLYVAAETVRDYPVENAADEQDDKKLQSFLADFFENPKVNNIFIIKTK